MNGLAVTLFLGIKQENLTFRLSRIKLIDEFLEGLGTPATA